MILYRFAVHFLLLVAFLLLLKIGTNNDPAQIFLGYFALLSWVAIVSLNRPRLLLSILAEKISMIWEVSRLQFGVLSVILALLFSPLILYIFFAPAILIGTFYLIGKTASFAPHFEPSRASFHSVEKALALLATLLISATFAIVSWTKLSTKYFASVNASSRIFLNSNILLVSTNNASWIWDLKERQLMKRLPFKVRQLKFNAQRSEAVSTDFDPGLRFFGQTAYVWNTSDWTVKTKYIGALAAGLTEANDVYIVDANGALKINEKIIANLNLQSTETPINVKYYANNIGYVGTNMSAIIAIKPTKISRIQICRAPNQQSCSASAKTNGLSQITLGGLDIRTKMQTFKERLPTGAEYFGTLNVDSMQINFIDNKKSQITQWFDDGSLVSAQGHVFRHVDNQAEKSLNHCVVANDDILLFTSDASAPIPFKIAYREFIAPRIIEKNNWWVQEGNLMSVRAPDCKRIISKLHIVGRRQLLAADDTRVVTKTDASLIRIWDLKTDRENYLLLH